MKTFHESQFEMRNYS